MARKEWMKQLRALVSQDDKIVYEFALQAVQTQPQVSPKLLNRALETAISFPHLTRSFLVYGNASAVNKDTLPLLLELESLLNFRQQMLLTRFYEHLNPKVICEHAEVLQGRLEDEFIQFNQTLVTSSDEDLEQIYYDLIQALNSDTKFNATYMASAKRVQDRLLKLDVYTENDVKDILKTCKSMEQFENYEAIFAIRAAGLLEEDDYVEQLAILLTSDMDVLVEEVINYYIAIGSKKAVKAVKPYLFVEESFVFALKILQGIASEKAIEVIVDAYEHMSNDDKAIILETLTFMLAKEALPLYEQYEQLGHDPVFLDMTYYYYNAYHYFNVEHPQLEQWRTQFEEQEDAAAIERENARQDLILRLKPGRNEKCICGSGKKFKKCCGAPVNDERYAFS
ncbi:MAG: SEC-C domain-containing protein [Caryophanon sp.]|nr:SEC-C domain-containing protein [Caryophanon sp.]